MKKRKTLNNAELASFCGELALLLPAGITPYDAIILMQKDAETDYFRKLLANLEISLSEGATLESALTASGVFPEYVISMVMLGEQSGNLDIIMRSLAAYYEQQCSISESVKSAVSYPLVMIVLMLLILIVLLTKVLPVFQQVFVQLGSELSSVSMHLMSLGHTVRIVSVALLIFFAFITVVTLVISLRPEGKRKITDFLHFFAPTRNYYMGIAYSRFASALSLISAGGIDLYEGIVLAQKLVDNQLMNDKIEIFKEHITKGDDLPTAIKEAGIFQSKQLCMLQVGYKSGNTDTVLNSISMYYENATLSKLHRIVSAIEPTLVIIFSLMVGLILLSVMMPLIGIMSSIG